MVKVLKYNKLAKNEKIQKKNNKRLKMIYRNIKNGKGSEYF